MLRTNLSTRPFYNERIVHVLLALAGVVVVLLTVFNAIRIVSLSRQNTLFSRLINQDRGEAERLTAEARKIRAGIDQDALKATAEAAIAANRLIDQRTFSWTEFFNRIEETLPPDVMLTAVQPSFDKDRSVVQMTVLGRRTEDVDEFIQKLEATGAFHEVLPTLQEETDDGLHQVMLRGVYRNSEADKPAAVPAASPAAPPDATPADAAATPGRGGEAR
jgi:Tfp pilus assembly protein PilN